MPDPTDIQANVSKQLAQKTTTLIILLARLYRTFELTPGGNLTWNPFDVGRIRIAFSGTH